MAEDEIPILSWEHIKDIAGKVGIQENQLVDSLKHLELLGHLIYLPGIL
jgi:hypothetical protein